MSTRAIIAHATVPGSGDWQGVYHHFDGYPTGLGARLHQLCREHFDGDPDALARYATREHSSWSLILAPGEQPEYGHAACHCHGDHAQPDDGQRYRPADLDDPDVRPYIEWVYVIDPAHLIVLAPAERSFKPVGHVAWAEDPDDEEWTRIECGDRFERCKHYAWVHFDVPDDARRLPTGKWLGHTPLDPVEDAIGWRLADDTPARRGGAGVAGSFAGRPRGWYETVTLPDGSIRDLRVCRGERTRQLRPDLTPIYPPTADQPGGAGGGR